MARARGEHRGHARAADPRRGERGLVLVYVSVLGFLMALVWAMSWRATHDMIHVERAFVRRSVHDASVKRAGAVATALLETGMPPSESYACIVTVTDGATTYDCLVEYYPVIHPWTWGIDVSLATADDVATYPAAPASF